ncbi:MAG: hypothetical protein M1826_004854 [Phylliscum demangeonii]|nr:MAG: hypothetical protein M1826_004854 [Phylliscum demangeonii]
MKLATPLTEEKQKGDRFPKAIEEAMPNLEIIDDAFRMMQTGMGKLRNLPALQGAQITPSTVQAQYEQATTIKVRTASAAQRQYLQFLKRSAGVRAQQKEHVVADNAVAGTIEEYTPFFLRNDPDLEFYQCWAVELFVRDIWGRLFNLGALDFDARPQDAVNDLAGRMSQVLIGHQVEASPAALPGPSLHGAAVASAAPRAPRARALVSARRRRRVGARWTPCVR